MAATIRPTLLLRAQLKPDVYSEAVVAELKRSYSYIAPISVVAADAEDAAGVEDTVDAAAVAEVADAAGTAENSLRFLIKLRSPYWLSSDEGADELFATVMEKWLTNMFNKVGNTLVAYNRVAREQGRAGLDFAWLELEFGPLVVTLRLGQDSAIPAQALSLVKQVREACNTGALSGFLEGTVRLPSRTSFAGQAAAAVEQATSAAEAVAGADAAEQAEETIVAADAADAAGAADAADVADVAGTRTVSEPSGEPEGEAGNKEPAQPAAQPDFELDYHVWGIETANGETREYDSLSGVFQD
ncbi:MAG: hypothetical protein LBR39_01060 [Coriobacteriales bacterium]|jgi:hypothetical protein|nr:hypothetical protein [Coriobacteriales bacterium]